MYTYKILKFSDVKPAIFQEQSSPCSVNYKLLPALIQLVCMLYEAVCLSVSFCGQTCISDHLRSVDRLALSAPPLSQTEQKPLTMTVESWHFKPRKSTHTLWQIEIQKDMFALTPKQKRTHSNKHRYTLIYRNDTTKHTYAGGRTRT